MKIGLIDNELCTRKNHSFPNLAIMKLSSYYKKQGHEVRLINFDIINPNLLFNEMFDKIFVSKVFTDTYTPDFIWNTNNTEIGGTGFFYDKAKPLHYDIEHSMPDYNIYDNLPSCKHDYYKKYSIGFLTRGCVRKCSFCINKNSNKVEHHADINEFYDPKRPFIMLLDDNITAYRGYYDIFDELDSLNIPFVFKQGMDFRLLNKMKMQRLWDSNYLSPGSKKVKKSGRLYHFAFDDISDYNLIEKRLKQYYYNKPYSFVVCFYVLVGFDRNNNYDTEFYLKDVEDLLIRIKLLFKYSAYPYVMLHEDYKKSPIAYVLHGIKGICSHAMKITNKTMEEALIQSKKYNTLKYIKKHHAWFLDIKFNSKLKKNH